MSQSGDFVFEVALLWLVLQTTGSVLDVGLVVVATQVPLVVLSPFLGVYVDRWPRRTVLIVTNLAEAALVAGLSGLVLSHAAHLELVLGIVVALSTGGQLVRVASTAMIPQMVGTADLTPANSLMQFSTSSTQIIGLSAGGIVIALFGVTLPIEYDALTFVAAALILVLMSRAVGRPDAGASRASFASDFAEGLHYLFGQRFLIEIVVIGATANFCVTAAATLFAPYADFVLRGGSVTYGFLGAAIAVGTLVGAAVIGKVDTRRSAGRYTLGGLAGVGAALVLLGLTRSIPAALAEMLLLGAVASVTNIPMSVVIQAKVPARLMGRIFSVLLSLILVAAPVGAFFAGSIAAATSVTFVYLVAGAAVLATAAVSALAMKELRTVAY